MAYVPVPKDLSKIKTKLAFNLTKRQLVCFSSAAAVGLPAYLFSRGSIGNSAAMFLMIGLMLPFFFLAMYERDGLPLEKGAVLFWDEPEANLNPKYIPVVAEMLLELQRNGVQVFVSTHDYFLTKYLEIKRTANDEILYHSLYWQNADEIGRASCRERV